MSVNGFEDDVFEDSVVSALTILVCGSMLIRVFDGGGAEVR